MANSPRTGDLGVAHGFVDYYVNDGGRVISVIGRACRVRKRRLITVGFGGKVDPAAATCRRGLGCRQRLASITLYCEATLREHS